MHKVQITISTTFSANPHVYGDRPEEAAETVRENLEGNTQAVLEIIRRNGFTVEDVTPVLG